MNEVLGWLIAMLVVMVAWPFVAWAVDHAQARPQVVFSPRTEHMLFVCKILLGECLFGAWLLPVLAGVLTGGQTLDAAFGAVRTERAWVGPGEIVLLGGGLLLIAVVGTLEIRRSLGRHQQPTAGSAPAPDRRDGVHGGAS